VPNREILIKDTHRGLWYEDGVMAKVLGAGRHELPESESWPELRRLLGLKRMPTVEVVLVDMRARDLTIKGQEILTADKVAIRVSIFVQFAVVDPKAALHAVANYEDRLYSDVQLAARRSLASMSLEDILTNRTRLSDDGSAMTSCGKSRNRRQVTAWPSRVRTSRTWSSPATCRRS
jgi:hypothetical protein